MSSATALGTLFKTNLKQWLSTKGFVLVVVAALFPLGLTSAWAATHQDDVVAVSVTRDPSGPLEAGDVVNFTAVIRNGGGSAVENFNASIAIGVVTSAGTLRPDAFETSNVERIEPGESHELRLQWTARAGGFYLLADADPDDTLSEVEEYNNQKVVPVLVEYGEADPAQAPAAPANLTGNATVNATADLSVSGITVTPGALTDFTNATVEVTVTNDGPDAVANASVTLRVGQTFGGEFAPSTGPTTTEVVDLEPGASATVTLDWTNARQGQYWVQAFVAAPQTAYDDNAENNHATDSVNVQPTAPTEPPAVPEKTTIKNFYASVLDSLYLSILIPFIALFYAGGVVTDERNAGTLPWLLTRPFGRWAIPVSRYAAGFAVGAVAIAIGVVATFVMLFQTPGGQDTRFLTYPLLVTLATLFVYGAAFVLLGVLTDRPFLVGVAIILGWEVVALRLVPFVHFFTLQYHVRNLLQGFFRIEEGVWLPPEADAFKGLLILLGIGLGFVGLSAVAMHAKEFRG